MTFVTFGTRRTLQQNEPKRIKLRSEHIFRRIVVGHYRRTIGAHHANMAALSRSSRGTDRATFAREASLTAGATGSGQTRGSLKTSLSVFARIARSAGDTRKTLDLNSHNIRLLPLLSILVQIAK